MAAQDKTEEPTQRRYDEARSKGQVARSHDATSFLLLLVAFLVLPGCAVAAFENLGELMRTSFQQLPTTEVTGLYVQQLLVEVGWGQARAWLPFVGAIVVAGAGADLLQTRFVLSTKPLMPDFGRINPLSGFGRIFSPRSLVELGKSLGKVAIIGLAVYFGAASRIPEILALSQVDLRAAAGSLSRAALSVCLQASGALLLVGAVDYLYQRQQYLGQLRMTKQEVKDEAKDTEGKPEVRSRIRQLQRQLARGRTLPKVREADLVVTNPTHFAVALQYRPEEMRAPRVVCKGKDLLAKQIRRIAHESGVSVVENPPIARALYRSTEVGQEIPVELYQAVAELLAFVFSLKQGGTRGRPDRG